MCDDIEAQAAKHAEGGDAHPIQGYLEQIILDLAVAILVGRVKRWPAMLPAIEPEAKKK